MSKIEKATAKELGLCIDLMQKLRNGSRTVEELEWFNLLPKSKLEEFMGVQTIESKLATFGNLARSKDIPLYYSNPTGTDPDIVNWLPNAIVSTNLLPKGKWKQVDTKNGTTEKTMLLTAQKMCLSQAVDVFTEELQKGTFDTLETYRIIFLEETDSSGNTLRLVCDRRSDGELDLSVYAVNPDIVWLDADVAWFEQQ